MKRSLLILVLSIVAACSPSNDDLKTIVDAKIDAMNQHDLDALGKLYADSARVESVGFEKIETGPEGIRGAYKRYYASTPDLKFEINNIIYGDHSAVIEYSYSGTMQQSPLEAVIPEYMIGKKYTLKTCTRIDVANGKIVREMTYFDQLAFLRQMGFFEQGG
jgi:steroid delta-isomerase-like uncharacterized protein